MERFNVIMVGPSGVGKTSFLAAVFNAMQTDTQSRFVVTPDEQSKGEMNARIRQIQDLGSASADFMPSAEVQVPGTQARRDYSFEVRNSQSPTADFELNFIDIPGGWYTDGSTDYQELLKESMVSFWVVDAVALMEHANRDTGIGRYQEAINNPNAIVQSYNRNQLLPGHAVVIVLLRCETYLRDKRGEELYIQFLNAYRDKIESIRNSNPNVQFLYCPVETVGCLFLNSIELKDNVPVAKFIHPANKPYEPSNCMAPMQLCMLAGYRQLLEYAQTEVSKRDTFFGRVLACLGCNRKLTQAKKLAESIGLIHESLSRQVHRDWREGGMQEL